MLPTCFVNRGFWNKSTPSTWKGFVNCLLVVLTMMSKSGMGEMADALCWRATRPIVFAAFPFLAMGKFRDLGAMIT
jgi:hypothetical protein